MGRYNPDECYCDTAVYGDDSVCSNALALLARRCGFLEFCCCPGDMCM